MDSISQAKDQMTKSAYSVCMLMEKPAQQRQPHDLEIEADRPVFDVIEVVFDSFLDRRVAAPAVDLRPARQSCFHLVAQHVRRNAMFELRHEMRTFGPRSDDR